MTRLSWITLLSFAPMLFDENAGAGCDACDPSTPTGGTNNAVGLRWGGSADLDLDASSFAELDHSVTLRFFSQYENSYEAPLFANTGSGVYRIAQGDFFNRNQPNLVIDFGSARAVYDLPDPEPFMADYPPTAGAVDPYTGHWRHLVLTKTASGIRLFLNGSELCPVSGNVSGCKMTLPSVGGSGANGAVRLGKRPVSASQAETQFYGFIDDVAVFDHALSQAEVTSLAHSTSLSGEESGLVRGYVFEEREGNPAKLSPGVTYNGAAYKALVSKARSNTTDSTLLPLPKQQVELQLPFPKGEAWVVIQGYNNDQTGSHKAYAAFCWDFIYATRVGSLNQDQSQSANKPLQAAAPGVVVDIVQSNDSGGSTNWVLVEHAPKELGNYLHLKRDSVPFSEGATIAAGAHVGDTSDTGAGVGAYHLHYATTDRTEAEHAIMRTFPVAFSGYEASDDAGASWYTVARGMPRPGQWVRRK